MYYLVAFGNDRGIYRSNIDGLYLVGYILILVVKFRELNWTELDLNKFNNIADYLHIYHNLKYHLLNFTMALKRSPSISIFKVPP